MSPQIEALIDIEISEKPFQFFYIQLDHPTVFNPSKFDEQIKLLNYEGFMSNTKFIVYGKVMYVFPHDIYFPVFYRRLELKNELMLCAGRMIVNFAPEALKIGAPKRTITSESVSLESMGVLNVKDSDEYKLKKLPEYLMGFFTFR